VLSPDQFREVVRRLPAHVNCDRDIVSRSARQRSPWTSVGGLAKISANIRFFSSATLSAATLAWRSHSVIPNGSMPSSAWGSSPMDPKAKGAAALRSRHRPPERQYGGGARPGGACAIFCPAKPLKLKDILVRTQIARVLRRHNSLSQKQRGRRRPRRPLADYTEKEIRRIWECNKFATPLL
jgi:hypothetical protein